MRINAWRQFISLFPGGVSPPKLDTSDASIVDDITNINQFVNEGGVDQEDKALREKRKSWVERVSEGNKPTRWLLDLTNVPLNSLPVPPTGEQYDGMFITSGREPDFDNLPTFLFHLTQWGIHGGWGGYAVLNEDGSYDYVGFDSTSADDMVLQNVICEANLPDMTEGEKENLLALANRFDGFFQLVERGKLSKPGLTGLDR